MAALKSTSTGNTPDVANVAAIGTVNSVAQGTVILAFNDDDPTGQVRDRLEKCRTTMWRDIHFTGTRTGDRAMLGTAAVAAPFALTSITAVPAGTVYVIFDAASNPADLSAAYDAALAQIDDYYANKVS